MVGLSRRRVLFVVLGICDGGLTAKSTEDEYLVAHNEGRALVGVGSLQWSKKLASYASKLATKFNSADTRASCDLYQHPDSFQYGLNQAVTNWLDSPPLLVASWVDAGKRFYNYANNSCAVGHHNECHTYTQLVWRNTLNLGCAKANCGKDGTHTICLYFPRGNLPGERPY